MDKARLIVGAFLWTGLVVAATLDPRSLEDDGPSDESEQWQRFSERCASDSLRTPSEPEADFIADGRPVEDFWTADVAGLYTVRQGPDPCDSQSGETCASALLAKHDEGWTPER
jgi:hypothetical protein